MEDDMYDSDSDGISWKMRYARARPATPPKAEPVLEYTLNFVEGQQRMGKCIDLAFVLDCTGSMQRYIDATRDHMIAICDMIRGEEGLSGEDDVRVALVNYRDHPPQDHSYVYRVKPFTSDVASVQEYVKDLHAACLTDLEWRREAARMVILIADAPPHGEFDFLPDTGPIKNGDPQGHDPLVIARTMAANGITLFMVACEETLSSYSRAVDFFQALCALTSGVMLPLMTADMLAMTIVGSVLENMDMERLIQEIGAEVASRIHSKGDTIQSVEEVAKELHERLALRNEQTKQVHLPEVYIMPDAAKRNVELWMSARLISDAASSISYIEGKRLTDKFRAQNRDGGYRYTGRTLPPRPSFGAPPTPATPGHPGSPGAGAGTTSPPSFYSSKFSPPGTPLSPGSGGGLRGAASPPRRVVSDFKAFGSPSAGGGVGVGVGGASAFGSPGGAQSVFGTKIVPTSGPGGGMFGSLGAAPTAGAFGKGKDRPRGGWDAEESDDEDELPAGPGLRKEVISLDQARRIATQSVFRAGRLG